MDMKLRIESAIENVLAHYGNGGPPKLAEAMKWAVLPGGARVRPRLCLAVSAACGDPTPELSNAAAIAIEFLHCASLVHDDLPCFDDANLRRGKSTVHVQYGEDLAVLSGDALIVLAFQVLAQQAILAPAECGELMRILGSAVGAPHGIVAGQAWECEEEVALMRYERAKTGSLFAACTAMGAVCSGYAADEWGVLGAEIGDAFQIADDILDAAGDEETIGKPVGQDVAHQRPSFALEFGVREATRKFEAIIDNALELIPACPGQNALYKLIDQEARHFVPASIRAQAA